MNSFAKRSIIQSAGLFAVFALIFIAAGTIDFWQAWLFCLTCLLCTTGTGLYLMKNDPALLERRMRFGPHEETRPRQKLIIAITFAVSLALMIVPGLDHRLGWSHLRPGIVVFANLVIAASFLFFIRVMRENTFAASTITVEPGQRVISTGPYAQVRHPMYSGAVPAVFAIPLALGSVWSLAITPVVILLLIARIFDEERALTAELPGYDDYRRAVPWRLLPLIW